VLDDLIMEDEINALLIELSPRVNTKGALRAGDTMNISKVSSVDAKWDDLSQMLEFNN